MENESKSQKLSITSIWGSIKRHPFYSGIGGLLWAYGLFGDGVKVVTDFLNNWEIFFRAPDSLWLRWLFVLAGLGLIGWGSWRSGEVDKKLKANHEIELRDLEVRKFEELSQQIMDIDGSLNSLQSSLLMAQYVFEHQASIEIAKVVHEAEKKLRDYEAFCAPFLGQETIQIQDEMTITNQRFDIERFLTVVASKISDDLVLSELNLKAQNPYIERDNPSSQFPVITYNPANNDEHKSLLKADLLKLRKRMTELTDYQKKQEKKLESIIFQIKGVAANA